MALHNASDFIEQLRELPLSVGQPSMRHLQRLGTDQGSQWRRGGRAATEHGLDGPVWKQAAAIGVRLRVCDGLPRVRRAASGEGGGGDRAPARPLASALCGRGEGRPGGGDPQCDPVTETPKAGSVPHHLPLDVRSLVGRGSVLKAADELVQRHRNSVFLISGPVGVGKTAFAIRWAHSMADDFPDGRLMSICGVSTGRWTPSRPWACCSDAWVYTRTTDRRTRGGGSNAIDRCSPIAECSSSSTTPVTPTRCARGCS